MNELGLRRPNSVDKQQVSVDKAASSLYIAADVNEQPTIWLLDTGSERNLMTLDAARRLKLKIDASNEKGAIIDISKNKSSILGTANVKLTFSNGDDASAYVVIIDKCIDDFILGQPFLRSHNVVIDAGRGQVSVSGVNVIDIFERSLANKASIVDYSNRGFSFIRRVTEQVPLNSDNWVCCFVTTEDTIVDASTTAAVPVKSNYRGAPMKVVTDDLLTRHSMCKTPHIIRTTNDKVMPVRNFGKSKVRIKRGTILCTGSQLDICSSSKESEPRPSRPADKTSIKRRTRSQSPTRPRRSPDISLHLNKVNYMEISQDLDDYSDLFISNVEHLTKAKVPPTKIQIKEGWQPTRQQQYRRSEYEHEIIDKIVKKQLDAGIIEPSASPWSSPVHLVRKKNGDYRMVLNYKKLNDATVIDHYSMPTVEDCLDTLRGKKLFTTLDLFAGFNQMPLDAASRNVTSFSTRKGSFQYTVMPFGCVNFPMQFSRLIDMVLGDLKWTAAIAYIDIIIAGKDINDLRLKTRQVFSRLRQFNVKLSTSKCQFAYPEVEFLGHIVSDAGIRACPRKIQGILNMPRPRTKTQLQSFMGKVGYFSKYILNYSNYSGKFTNLLVKDAPFKWDASHQMAFEKIKQYLMKPPILTYFDPNKRHKVYVDACDYAIGGCLKQVERDEDENETEKIVACFSRTLTRPERNYTVTEKECLAVVEALKRFHIYLHMRPFTMLTDHCCLKYLRACNIKNSRVLRWSLLLAEHPFMTIEHIKGKLNHDADCLSRLPDFLTDLNLELPEKTPRLFDDSYS